jgi:hypothetical protein
MIHIECILVVIVNWEVTSPSPRIILPYACRERNNIELVLPFPIISFFCKLERIPISKTQTSL